MKGLCSREIMLVMQGQSVQISPGSHYLVLSSVMKKDQAKNEHLVYLYFMQQWHPTSLHLYTCELGVCKYSN